MNTENLLQVAYNVGYSIQTFHRCLKVLDSYRKNVKDDAVLTDLCEDLKTAITKIDIF